MTKEKFLDIITGTSPEQLQEFIRQNGKEPKLINPIILISETRYNLKGVINNEQI